jgi:hypothetical protein
MATATASAMTTMAMKMTRRTRAVVSMAVSELESQPNRGQATPTDVMSFRTT